MKSYKKYVPMALFLAGLAFNTGCGQKKEPPKEQGVEQTVKTDFVKINKVGYTYDTINSQPSNEFYHFSIEGYDSEGIKEIKHYIDGKEIMFTYSTSQRTEEVGDPFRKSYKLQFNSDSANLEKGKHTLKVELEDNIGNITKDEKDFEVSFAGYYTPKHITINQSFVDKRVWKECRIFYMSLFLPLWFAGEALADWLYKKEKK